MALIAHLSDPHLGPLPPVKLRDLRSSKRFLGYVNWKGNRARNFEETALSALITDMKAASPDHIAVTGDLVNIGLDAEFDLALAWLHTLGNPNDVTVVPGNHDAYAARAIEQYSAKWLPFAGSDKPTHAMAFPFIRRRGRIAIIGVSTAVATAPLMATGRIEPEQADALGDALAETGREGLCRVVLIHHPPTKGATNWPRRLINARLVREVIARNGAELVLHGHNHKTSVRHIPGLSGPVPVVGAAGLSIMPHGRHRGGAYNLLTIKGEKPPYRIDMNVRGFGIDGAVATIMEMDLT